jgi:hypothetical protein
MAERRKSKNRKPVKGRADWALFGDSVLSKDVVNSNNIQNTF